MKRSFSSSILALITLGPLAACSSEPGETASMAAAALETDPAVGSRTEAALKRSGIAEKDIAIVFDFRKLALARATDKNRVGEELLPARWYSTVTERYKTGPVGRALEIENVRSEWSVVAARIEPCGTLGRSVQEQDDLCWPEVRLVWQPIKRNLVDTLSPLKVAAFADDRAIHTIYDVPPSLAWPAAEAAEAAALIKRIRGPIAAGTAGPGGGGALSPAERNRFRVLRNLAATDLIDSAVALRSLNIPAARYSAIATRPELEVPAEEAPFLARWSAFLDRYARNGQLKQLTSFSFTQGRRPVDAFSRWEFIGFRPSPSGLQPDAAPVFSAKDGSALFGQQSGTEISIGGCDFQFDNDLQSLERTNPARAAEARGVTLNCDAFSRSFPGAQFRAERIERIVDRAQVSFANSTCASCHILDTARPLNGFDFHNFSNFNSFRNTTGTIEYVDSGFGISPRVRREVEFDIGWVRTRL